MNKKILKSLLLASIAIIFTLALTFASIELPKLADDLLHENISFVNVYTGGGDLQEIKAELFIRHFHLRTIGYFCLALVIILIIFGFITERTGLTSLGAFAIFLPVFGHFAATMFFLGGLGFLRLLWLPGLDLSFDIMKLGDAVFIPNRIIMDIFNVIGINLYSVLPYILILGGLLIFCLGTVIWFKTYYDNDSVAQSGLYKYSRHPQYFGWIIWSYGIMFLPGANMKQSYSISDSLPWLISTLVIIGVAMLEEIKMSKKHGEVYNEYRKKSYFMMPFPKYVCRVISAPFRVFFQKNYPERKREIIIVLFFYFSITILLTLTLNNAAKMTSAGKWVFEGVETRSINSLVNMFATTPSRREKYKFYESMLDKGDSSINYFVEFLEHPDPVVREFSADGLGILRSHNTIDPLLNALKDENIRVVNSVLRSLGNYKSEKAVNSLVDLLKNENQNIRSLAARALVRIGNSNAVDSVIPLAEEEIIKPNTVLINALSNNPKEKTEKLIIKYIFSEDINIKRAAVIGARNFNSDEIQNALRESLNDEDWEVRLYAEEILKIIGNT